MQGSLRIPVDIVIYFISVFGLLNKHAYKSHYNNQCTHETYFTSQEACVTMISFGSEVI